MHDVFKECAITLNSETNSQAYIPREHLCMMYLKSVLLHYIPKLVVRRGGTYLENIYA